MTIDKLKKKLEKLKNIYADDFGGDCSETDRIDSIEDLLNGVVEYLEEKEKVESERALFVANKQIDRFNREER